MIGSWLSALAALAFLGLGAGAARVPDVVAEGYGISAKTDGERAYVRAVGARDAALGLLVLWCLSRRARAPLRAVLAASALVGASDFIIVFGSRGLAARPSLAIHALGTIGLLVTRRLVPPEPS